MKKYLCIAAILIGFTASAQHGKHHKDSNYGTDISIIIDHSDHYGLSKKQREELILRKKTIGREFAAIGKDRSLSGLEKGLKKRELALSIQNDIQRILNKDQYSKWQNQYAHKYEREANKENIERRLDLLEDVYEQDIKRIESKRYKNKDQMKQEKEKRKAIYKAEKEKLKQIKDNL